MVRDPFLKVEETALIFVLILSSHVIVFVFHVLILLLAVTGSPHCFNDQIFAGGLYT